MSVRRAWSRFRNLFRNNRLTRELDEEIRAHLELEEEDRRADGLFPGEARHAARRAFGNITLRREESREMWIYRSLEILLQDIRYGLRMLRKNPGFTAIAVLTLALGIGANSALFSILHAVLLRPLSYSQPERLVILSEMRHDGAAMSVAYPNFQDWAQRTQSFEPLAAFQRSFVNWTGEGEASRLNASIVSWNLFELLGVQPQIGRPFAAADDQAGAAPVTLLTHEFWERAFGADPGVVGRSLTFDGMKFTVIGVLPPRFRFFRADDVFTVFGPLLTPRNGFLDRGNHFGIRVLGRLKSKSSLAAASSEMDTLAAALAREYPATNSGNGARVAALDRYFVADVRPALLVLFGAVFFVLLIACANVANLLLARAAGREKEMAVRAAMGAGRNRLLRQLLTESLLIAGLGAAAGLLLARWTLVAMLSLVPEGIPRLDEARLDSTVLAFTMGIAVLTGIFFGLFPALRAFRASPQGGLKAGGGGSTGGTARNRPGKALLAAEVALALALLISAGLMIRTMAALSGEDLGFRPQNLLTLEFDLAGETYTAVRRTEFCDRLLEKLRAVPGVDSAALTLSLPVEGSRWGSIFIVGDKPAPPRAELPSAAFTPVSDAYFQTMGIRLLRGRTFSAADQAKAPEVTVINERLARTFWPGEDPIGKRLKQGWPEDKNPWREVIGVVADVKMEGADQDTPLQSYLPLGQESVRHLALVLRSRQDPSSYARAVSTAIRSLDPNLPVYRVRPMEEILSQAVQSHKFTMALLSIFAILALALAAVGIYGVISHGVAQRKQEIAIRLALGAQPRQVLRMVLGQGIRYAAVGTVLGLAGSMGLSRLLKSLVYGVRALDPLTYSIVTLLMVGVALLACAVPAWRAMRVDPLVALRFE